MSEEKNGSKGWMLSIRIIVILLGILQLIILGWAKFVTVEVIKEKTKMSRVEANIQFIKEQVKDIRDAIVAGTR